MQETTNDSHRCELCLDGAMEPLLAAYDGPWKLWICGECRNEVDRERYKPVEVLHADQFGNLDGNHFHRVLRCVQPVPGTE